ncbi:MAG TPA: hypothetical protein VK528_02765 [Flavobacterium sp.]|nr:hypothetical protein [Flavobacterium sp.]
MNSNENTSDFSRVSLIVLFVLLLLSSIGMFGQNVQPAQTTTIALQFNVASSDDNAGATTVTNNTTEYNANMNMVSWFMGTKQTPKADVKNVDENSKKQMINSGIAPNRLLMKAFLKKASNYQSTIA